MDFTTPFTPPTNPDWSCLPMVDLRPRLTADDLFNVMFGFGVDRYWLWHASQQPIATAIDHLVIRQARNLCGQPHKRLDE